MPTPKIVYVLTVSPTYDFIKFLGPVLIENRHKFIKIEFHRKRMIFYAHQPCAILGMVKEKDWKKIWNIEE